MDTSAQANSRRVTRPIIRIVLLYAALAALWIAGSDALLFLLIPAPEEVQEISLYKGFGFVAVTSFFLYLILRQQLRRQPDAAEPPALAADVHPPNPRLVAGTFVLLTIGIVAGTAFILHHRSTDIRERVLAELNAIADLKVKQIENWLVERHGDAQVLATDERLAERVRRWFETGDAESQAIVKRRLENVLAAYPSYESAALLDSRGVTRLSVGKDATHAYLREMVRDALRTGKPKLGDLHRESENPDVIHQDYIIPLIPPASSARVPIGAIVLNINPRLFLYPLLQSWPVPSASGEVHLVRREGDKVMFLSNTRYHKDSALRMQIPLDTPQLPAAQAVRQKTGTYEGVDIRGIPVMAAFRPVSGTPWVMVAKIDRDEIFAPIRRFEQGTILLTVVAVGIAGAVVWFVWGQQSRYYRLSLQAREFDHQALVQHYDYLTKYANDAVLLADEADRLVEANDRALELYGYTREEMLRLSLRELRTPAARTDAAFDYQQLYEQGRRLYETHARRKDGGEFPVEVSAAVIETDGGRYRQFIVRDISGRKQAEQKLAAAEHQFRSLVEQTIAGIFIVVDNRLEYVNPRFAEIFGYTAQEMIGVDLFDTVAAASREDLRRDLERCSSGAERSVVTGYIGVRKDGTPVEIGVHLNRGEHDGRAALIGVMQDIGEKKRAEQKIHEYVERLEKAMLGTINAVSTMSEMRDPYTTGHERRVGSLAAAIATELGLPADTVKGLEIIGNLHDIGKIYVPAEILSRPGKLTPAEFEIIKSHPQQGYEILKGVDFPWPVAQVVLQHHERLDGSGYPNGLKGDAILPEARIIAVADVVEAMSSHRPFRPGHGVEVALDEITKNRGRLYDEKAVDACVRLFREKGYALPA